MTLKSRRKFLELTAQSSFAVAGFSLFSKNLQEALAMPVPKGQGNIHDVKHIVIFMQENRSFDHYFGTLKGVRGFNDPRAIKLPTGKSVWYQPMPHSQYGLPFHLNSKETSSQWLDNLDHSWKGSQKTWEFYDCWIEQKSSLTMGYFNRTDIPFYYSLADAFTIGDAYHASLFGPTDPNRMFLFTGTSGLTVGAFGEHVVHNKDDGNETADMNLDLATYASYSWKTYAERLQEAGISWKVYQEYDNYGDNALAYFNNFRNLSKDSPLYKQGRQWVEGSHSGNAKTSQAQFLVDAFAKDIRNHTLPAVSWIVAPTQFCEHPSWPPSYGESLTARLLDELAKDKEIWSSTAFIINYDENDGYFDHVPPLNPPVNRASGLSTVDLAGEIYNGEPLGLGVRVPLLIVSPWTKGGWVCSEVFDHTSIIRFLEKRFQVYEPNISPWRRAICGDLTSMFDFKTPDLVWPNNLLDTTHFISKTNATKELPNPTNIPNRQLLPKQEKGVRPARALPYHFLVNGKANLTDEKFYITFINLGTVGAGFIVYDMSNNSSPKYYTLDKMKRVMESWDRVSLINETYEFNVHGPNGFFRKFRGKITTKLNEKYALPNIYLSYFKNNLLLNLINSGLKPCTFKIVDNSYGEPVQFCKVNSRTQAKKIIKISKNANWYDISISVDTDDAFYNQFAGHVETGLASISDPAMGL